MKFADCLYEVFGIGKCTGIFWGVLSGDGFSTGRISHWDRVSGGELSRENYLSGEFARIHIGNLCNLSCFLVSDPILNVEMLWGNCPGRFQRI